MALYFDRYFEHNLLRHLPHVIDGVEPADLAEESSEWDIVADLGSDLDARVPQSGPLVGGT